MARTPKYDPETGEQIESKGLATWQKLIAILSLLLGGVGLAATLKADPAPAPTSNTRTTVGADGFVVGMPGGEKGSGEAAEAPSSLSPWAPLAAKGGLSFFLAFCIGYALRAALKVTMLVIGVGALAFFGLQYVGVIESIDWSRASEYWDDVSAKLGDQVEGFAGFVKGSLPSTASGAVGLVAGFKRS
ncbi:MAG: FUN14 domain-containing protein [Planctomycetota bacterium]